jgi:hypothetical protein
MKTAVAVSYREMALLQDYSNKTGVSHRSLCLGRFVGLASICCPGEPPGFGSSTAQRTTRKVGH